MMKPFVEGDPFAGWTTFTNGKYVAMVRPAWDRDGEQIVVLSVRRNDRKPIMDWRDLQWIKNQLLGPEIEAVQLFPAESRLVDTANQYYLTAYAKEGFRFPFGFKDRMVSELSGLTPIRGPNASPTKQRPFADHVRPSTNQELKMRPLTIQIRIDEPFLNYAESDCQEIYRAMIEFADKLGKFGRVSSQMSVGQDSYNGEPL